MERKKTALQGAMAGIGLLVLIFDSELAVEGARNGIHLCMMTVIPSLFPFFVLSMLLTNSLSSCRSPKWQVLAKGLGIPPAAAPVLIPSILGGYPVGAKCAGDLYRNHQLSKEEAERLLAFCSNAGPSFLFGMVSGFFSEQRTIWLLWFIHLFSAVLTALVIPPVQQQPDSTVMEKRKDQQAVIGSAAKAMGLVCCWVILFRMVITFLNDWLLWLAPDWGKVLLTGFLELTNGCCELQLISDETIRFILCSCMLAFGGLCVLLQTAGVTRGLSLSWYLRGKALQTAFSLLLSSTVVLEQGLLLLPIFLILLLKIQKRYGNPRAIPV